MRAPARRLALAAIGSILLSGCWLFPPLFPPLEPESRTYVVENATEADWVIELRSDLPTAYAIPAGQRGTVTEWGIETQTIVLMTAECEALDELEATVALTGVRIEDPGTLAADDGATATGLEPFAEYWSCTDGFGAEPVAEAALPGASGAIFVYGEDSLPYRYDPMTGTIEAALPAGDPSFYDGGHTWSPDGTQVAYAHSTEASPSLSIYVANTDGTDATLVVENASSPAWSPDGRQLAYVDADPFAGEPGLWVVDLDTDQTTQVAQSGSQVAWSPDGTQLAYVSGFGFGVFPEEEPASEVHIVNADGTDDRMVGVTVPFGVPAWSPDGTRLAFASVAAGDGPDDPLAYVSAISVLDPETGELSAVASVDGAGLAEPAWSPDGTRIAFSGVETDLFSSSAWIGIVDAHGGEIARLVGATDGAYVSTPLWSPDGTWIVAGMQGGTDELVSSLVALDPDDPDAEPITLATGVHSVLAWD